MIADAAPATALTPSNPVARSQRRLWAYSGVAAAARSAPCAGATFLRLGPHALGRMVHAVFRHEDPVLAGVQAPYLRRRDSVSDAGTGGDDGEHGRNRAADPARVRISHPLGRARPFVHDWRHPAHLSGWLGELPFVLGGDGACDHHLRPRRDLARQAHRPRRLERA